jgi:hypothetical protein
MTIALMKMPLAGGTPTTLATGQDGPLATSVYWANGGPNGGIMKLTPK